MPASEPLISKGSVEHTSNCEFLLKIYHFSSFWKSLSSTKPTYIPTLSAIYALIPYQNEVNLNADVSENRLPFVSQSITNFSDYDISQNVDWECPSLPPHVLLFTANLQVVLRVSAAPPPPPRFAFCSQFTWSEQALFTIYS